MDAEQLTQLKRNWFMYCLEQAGAMKYTTIHAECMYPPSDFTK